MSWTKKDQAKLREYQTAQMTVAEIAEKMDRPIEWIRVELERMGYKPIEDKSAPEPSEFLEGLDPVSIGRKPYARITTGTKKRVLELRDEGMSLSQIASDLNISASSITRIVRESGASRHYKTKEPAPSANDASSEQDITPVIPVINDITPEVKCQEPGINAAVMATLLLSTFDEAFGRECEPIGIKADRDHLDLSFFYEGKEYYIVFGQARHYEYASGGERV